MCKVKFGHPLPAAVKLTPTLSASSHVPKKGTITRIYFVRDQVPDCPVFTRAKK